MSTTQPSYRIGILGNEPPVSGPLNRHPGLWAVGYSGSVSASDAIPVELCLPNHGRNWNDILEEIDGVVFSGFEETDPLIRSQEEELCRWCKKNKMPLLAIDRGLQIMNTAFGGTLYFDLPRELPEALQHRHPPEEGIRHAINVLPNTHLAKTYGEGEIIVNSEHHGAIQRLARGFRICGEALDGVIEAIEWEKKDWFALGVQWQPASATSSGLDIQVFRTLVNAASDKATQLTENSAQPMAA